MPWPAGDRNLIVAQGKYQSIEPNSFPTFKNIVVESGGTLAVGHDAWAANPWMQIGCAGDFILRGTLLVRGSPLCVDGTYDWQASDGTHRTAIFQQQSGGVGGSAYGTPHWPGGTAGKHAYGNGGGGAASFGVGQEAKPTSGGDGGRANPYDGKSQQIGAGGNGGRVSPSENEAAGNGSPGVGPDTGRSRVGGGGGGGARGLHGGFLYLRVLGRFDATGGLIDASGADGGAGGLGGGAATQFPEVMFSGAGGGGGAGGNGGLVIVSHRTAIMRGLEDVSAGTGGSGGLPGLGSRQPINGRPGAPGLNGTPGRIEYLFEP